MLKKIKIALTTSIVSLLFVGTAQAAFAASAVVDPCHPENYGGKPLPAAQLTSCQACTNAGLKPDINNPNDTNNNGAIVTCVKNNVIVNDINNIVNVLSGIVGIVVVGTIILGGIQYSMAGGKPDATVNANKRIINGIVALAAFLLVWGFLQWIIPGGIFS